ncbi:Gon7-domain-containing protein [Sarocladium strictum]
MLGARVKYDDVGIVGDGRPVAPTKPLHPPPRQDFFSTTPHFLSSTTVHEARPKLKMAESQQTALTGSYKSPDNASFSVNESLPTLPATASVNEKTKYLNSLREAITSAQDQINKELTQRMEDDKVRLAAGAPGAKIDDAKEEENYGEEVPEED